MGKLGLIAYNVGNHQIASLSHLFISLATLLVVWVVDRKTNFW